MLNTSCIPNLSVYYLFDTMFVHVWRPKYFVSILCRAARVVKHLHTQFHFLAHAQYLDMLIGLSKTFRLEYVIGYDVELRKRVHSAPLSCCNPWLTTKDADIFQVRSHSIDLRP
eukprot:SAG11_NODE_5380_length_1578_cov_1.574713_1_plen_114_part_00